MWSLWLFQLIGTAVDLEDLRLLKCLKYQKAKLLLADSMGQHSETGPLRLTQLAFVPKAEAVAHIKIGKVVGLVVGEDGEDINLRQILS